MFPTELRNYIIIIWWPWPRDSVRPNATSNSPPWLYPDRQVVYHYLCWWRLGMWASCMLVWSSIISDLRQAGLSRGNSDRQIGWKIFIIFIFYSGFSSAKRLLPMFVRPVLNSTAPYLLSPFYSCVTVSLFTGSLNLLYQLSSYFPIVVVVEWLRSSSFSHCLILYFM